MYTLLYVPKSYTLVDVLRLRFKDIDKCSTVRHICLILSPFSLYEGSIMSCKRKNIRQRSSENFLNSASYKQLQNKNKQKNY